LLVLQIEDWYNVYTNVDTLEIAMSLIGIRELKEHTSEVLRRVREHGETVDVTYRGRVVARLIPVNQPQPSEDDLNALWADMDRLAAEIGMHWPGGVSAVEAVDDVRRSL
jgi:prevent-host-death family protein